MNKKEKSVVVEELQVTLGSATNAFVLGFSGINVPDVTELRRQVRLTLSKYLVVKNTLALRAIEGGPLASLAPQFSGMTAVVYNSGSPVALAKALSTFARTNTNLKFKGAIVEGRPVAASQIQVIADLPSREELVAKMLFVMQSPVRRLVTVMNGPARNLVSALSQIAEKKA